MLRSDTKRKPKVEGVLRTAEEKLQKAIDINNQLKALAASTNNPQETNEDLDEWLKKAMKCHDQNTTMARSYLDSPRENAAEDRQSVCSQRSAGSRSHKGSHYCASRNDSMTSSQRRHAFDATKLRTQETERQNAAVI